MDDLTAEAPPDDTVVSRLLHASAAEPPLLRGERPWWDELDPEFWRKNEPFDLDEVRDARAIRRAAGSDRLVQLLAGSAVGGLALPLGYHPGKLGELREHLAFYAAIAEACDPRAFFVDPVDVRVKAQPARFARYRPWDGHCEDLSFESPFEPVNPSLATRWARNRRNAVAHARFWRHRHGPRPTIIAIHGFAAEGYAVNEWFFNLPWLYGMGCDVLLVTLPFHGPRQGRLSPFSGHGFFSGGLGWTNEAFAQGVADIRSYVRWLLDVHGAPAVGVTGVSLGGHTAALLACVEDRLAFSLPNVPVASLPDLVLEWQPLGLAVRGLMKVTGLEVRDLRRLAAASCPLTWKPILGRERRMIIGGVGDRLAPPKHTRLLWDHWDRCRIHWFPGSHLLHLDRGAYLWQVARFLRGIGFLAADHPSPSR